MSNYGITVGPSFAKSKKAVKEAVAENPGRVVLHSYSIFGNPAEGPITEVPDGRYHFVGPDPQRDRRFYGTITKRGDTFKVA